MILDHMPTYEYHFSTLKTCLLTVFKKNCFNIGSFQKETKLLLQYQCNFPKTELHHYLPNIYFIIYTFQKIFHTT